MDDLDRMVKIFRIGLFILCALIFATCAEVFAGCVYPDTGYAMGETGMKPIVDAAVFDTVYTPENGDAADASGMEIGTIQPLADRTKFLKDMWATYKLKNATQTVTGAIGSIDWEIDANPSGMFGVNGSDRPLLPSPGNYMLAASAGGVYTNSVNLSYRAAISASGYWIAYITQQAESSGGTFGFSMSGVGHFTDPGSGVTANVALQMITIVGGMQFEVDQTMTRLYIRKLD